MRAELLVVGAGPGGMAAALAAADAGCQVLLVDSSPTLGGQIYRQPATVDGHGMVSARLPRRFHRVADHPRIAWVPSTTVWGADASASGLRFWLTGSGGDRVVRCLAVVLATGATELALPFPGWDLPGVMTPGAAQALVKAHGVVPGKRVLVAGTGPFLLPVAATLAGAGASVTLAEAARPWRRPDLLARAGTHPGKVLEAASYLATLARHRVRPLFGHVLAACSGTGRVEQARLVTAGLRRRELVVDVDAVCAGYGFVPAVELPRALGCLDRPHGVLPLSAVAHDGEQATSVPGVFVAGEAGGIGGAVSAELEGLVAGAAAARSLGRLAAVTPLHVRARLRRARRFASVLEALYPLGGDWIGRLRDTCVFCRCEDITWGQVRAATAAGAADLRTVKGLTRCGMGYCQGRTCGPALQLAVQALTGRPLREVGDLSTRTLIRPVPLGVIAAAGGEAGEED